MAEKQQFETIFAPKGTATGYVYLNTPDKGKEEWGNYTPQYKLAVSYNESPSKLIVAIKKEMERVKQEAEAQAAKWTKEKKKQFEAKPASLPYFEDPDDGTTTIRTSSYASFKSKKTGEVVSMAPALYDHQVKPIDRNKIGTIASGSIVRPKVTVAGWVNAKCEYGVKLRLDAAQIIKPVYYTGGGDVSGFDVEEGEDIEEMDDGFGVEDDGGDDEQF